MLGNFAWIKVLSSTKDSQTKATAKLVYLLEAHASLKTILFQECFPISHNERRVQFSYFIIHSMISFFR